MEPLYIVTVTTFSGVSEQELDSIALEKFNSLGKVDFNLDEERVDEILGKDAYCGGDIPEDLLQKLETTMQSSSSPTYFWESYEDMEGFVQELKSKNFTYELREEEKKDWNESWRQSFNTIDVTETLQIVPSWEADQDSSEKIFIYPGMGFGTGNHQTTFLCLKIFSEIKEELNEGLECLDFGCGSGILGIAALKQKKARVDFVDIDKDALDNCLLNLEHNKYQNYREGHALVLRDRFKLETNYPLVFANILENILELEYETIRDTVSSGGHLIVSGLLKGQEDNIISKYKDFHCQSVAQKDDWVAIHFTR